ncbi:MAG: pilus assembly FimT family protein [Phycisphaerales bacterium]
MTIRQRRTSRTDAHAQRRAARAQRRRAFTLIELIVSITIIVIVAALTLPAITQIVRSNNYAAAINNVTATLTTARSIATRRQTYAGVAFLFDARTRTYSLQIIELASTQSGRLSDEASANLANNRAAVFKPAENTALVVLPSGTAVYGLAAGHDLDEFSGSSGKIDNRTASWYAGWRYGNTPNPPADELLTPWIFPLNDPATKLPRDPGELGRDRVGFDPFGDYALSNTALNPRVRQALRHSQTFMVLFAPDGSLTTTIRLGGKSLRYAFLEFPNDPRRPGASPEDPAFDTPLLFDPEAPLDPPPGINATAARRIPNPEILLAAVPAIAVVDLRQLSEAQNPPQGAFPDDDRLIVDPRPWLIVPEDAEQWLLDGANTGWPDWVAAPPGGRNYVDDDRYAAKCRWIDRNAEIISFNRYTGQVLRSSRQ